MSIRRDDPNKRDGDRRAHGAAEQRRFLERDVIAREVALAAEGRINRAGQVGGLVQMGQDSSAAFKQRAVDLRDRYTQRGMKVPTYLERVAAYAEKFGPIARASADADGRLRSTLETVASSKIVLPAQGAEAKASERPSGTKAPAAKTNFTPAG